MNIVVSEDNPFISQGWEDEFGSIDIGFPFLLIVGRGLGLRG